MSKRSGTEKRQKTKRFDLRAGADEDVMMALCRELYEVQEGESVSASEVLRRGLQAQYKRLRKKHPEYAAVSEARVRSKWESSQQSE